MCILSSKAHLPVSCLSVLKLFLHANHRLVPVAPDVSISIQRRAYLEKPSESPSSAAMPSVISKAQNRDEPDFLCSRPRKAEDPVPVTLLHPIFAEFVDDCRDLKPTHLDYRFVRELSEKMCMFFSDENARMEAFRTQLADSYDIALYNAGIGATAYSTDGHLMIGGKFIAVIAKGKKEIGSGGSEPFVEAMCCQREFMKFLHKKPFHIDKLRSVFPCFHIIVFGACIGIVGSVFTGKVKCDILGPIIPLFCHSTDDSMQSTAARMFAALKLAITKLVKLYSDPILPITPQDSPLDCPYPQDYDNGTQHFFSYNHNQPLRRHRIFFGETSIGEKICIKYVKRYSPEAHRFCAEEGRAPRLIAYKSLPGGWNMVVMNVLPIHNDPSSRSTSAYQQFSQIPAAEREPLEKAVTDFIHRFHKKGFVHGDIRDTNLFLLGGDFMLLDFDWSGGIGKTHYPMHVNCEGIHRPLDARDGNEIKVGHDLEMLRHVFHPEGVATGALQPLKEVYESADESADESEDIDMD
ncbi:hypothetical protein DFH29DRAFT_811543 [Suillus ampliporus]|nr:hypothetical protein DFH29DRAFT_811543 [Suillus ampliporus]